MSSRSTHLRTKVMALLVSLTALWAFAAFVTVRDGLNLLWVATLANKVGKPSESLVEALQQERRDSVVYLGGHTGAQRDAMQDRRRKTDEAAATFRESARGTQAGWAASADLERRIDDLVGKLDGLRTTRTDIDALAIGRAPAANVYTDLINTNFQIYGSLASLDNDRIAREGRALVTLSRARELLAQEDTLLSGALAAGRLSDEERGRFTQLAGAQRFVREEAAPDLRGSGQERYQQLVAGQQDTRVLTLEELVSAQGRGDQPVPTTAAAWNAAVQPVYEGLREVVLAGSDDAVDAAKAPAAWVIIRLLLAGGLGLLAVVASIIVSITTARTLVRQLEKLRVAAWDLSSQRLPGVVERLRHGEKVDVAAEAPPLKFGNDEVGQVGQAFNAVQQTAIGVAVEQAELRRGVRELFLGLARRNQALVHRQLKLLDVIERRETDAEELSDLFRVDHLATRMRRNAENLIVLSGAVPGRRWRNPVPMVDVVRGAVAEVEDYTRVTVLPIEAAALAGRAVGDVIHLLAELIENAASFSPPYTVVQVGGQLVANGFVVEIEDRGLGMSQPELDAANEVLREPPPEFNLTSTARMGLFVVGQLAERHGIRVELRRSPYGGTTAIVLVPTDLVINNQAGMPVRTSSNGHSPAIAAGITTPIGVDPDDLDSEDLDPDEPPPLPVDPAASPVESPEPGLPVRASALQPPAEATDPEATAEYPLVGRRRAAEEPPPEAASVAYTPAGLPVRVRQASLAAALRDSLPADEPPDEAKPARTPEEIRDMMASYQQATRRGRDESQQVGSQQVGSQQVGSDGDDVPPASA